MKTNLRECQSRDTQFLTTAFVIFGAWRRAVRDAEVDAMDEDDS